MYTLDVCYFLARVSPQTTPDRGMTMTSVNDADEQWDSKPEPGYTALVENV